MSGILWRAPYQRTNHRMVDPNNQFRQIFDKLIAEKIAETHGADSMRSAKPATTKSPKPEKLETRVWHWITFCLSSPDLQDQPKPIARAASLKRKAKKVAGSCQAFE